MMTVSDFPKVRPTDMQINMAVCEALGLEAELHWCKISHRTNDWEDMERYIAIGDDLPEVADEKHHQRVAVKRWGDANPVTGKREDWFFYWELAPDYCNEYGSLINHTNELSEADKLMFANSLIGIVESTGWLDCIYNIATGCPRFHAIAFLITLRKWPEGWEKR